MFPSWTVMVPACGTILSTDDFGVGLVLQDALTQLIQRLLGQPGISTEWMVLDGSQQPRGPVKLANLIYFLANGTSPAACPSLLL